VLVFFVGKTHAQKSTFSVRNSQSFFPVVVFADIKHPEKWMILPAF